MGAYARRAGWWPRDFRLGYRISDWSGQIHFLFLSDGFDEDDFYQNHRLITEYLATRTKDDPGLSGSVILATSTLSQALEGGVNWSGSDFSPIKPRDLFRRSIRDVADLISKFVADRGWHEENFRFLFKRETSGTDQVVMTLHLDQTVSNGGDTARDLNLYLGSRLFDEPDILSTADLTIRAEGPIDLIRVQAEVDAGYRDYFATSQA